MTCFNAIKGSIVTSVVECESDRVCRQLIAPLEALLEVSADVVPDLWAGVGFRRRFFTPSRRVFIPSRRLPISKVKPDIRYG
jgi:hypothetical protein